MNRLPNLIKNNWQKLNTVEQIVAVGSVSGVARGWGIKKSPKISIIPAWR